MAQLIANGEDISEEIQTLANGPFLAARKCNSYTIDGYNFHTNSYDQGRPSQSSGVALVSQILSSTSEDNENLMVRNKIYYGVITEILELNYNNKGSIVLFKCDWVDNSAQDKWVQVDDLGVTQVNFKHLLKSDEPFILASQATQVYYVQDKLDKDWYSVRSFPHPRDLYDMCGVGDEDFDHHDAPTVSIADLDANVDLSVDVRNIPRCRTDIDGTLLPAVKQPKCVPFPFIFQLHAYILDIQCVNSNVV